MKVRTLVFTGAIATALALPVPATAGASTQSGPTLTLERECSNYPPRHEVNATLAGFPPFTSFFGEIEFPDGTSLGSSFTTDADVGFFFPGLGVETPGNFTATVTWGGSTLVTTVFVNCAVPTSTDECKNGGWKTFGVFKNQGDCVSFVATKGKNPPASGP